MKLISVFLVLFSIMMFSCIDPINDPYVDSPIVGKWKANITDLQQLTYKVELEFKDSGVLVYDIVEDVAGHNDSQAKFRIDADNTLIIYDDSDCEAEGKYLFNISGSSLNIELIEDDCTPRIIGLESTWTKM